MSGRKFLFAVVLLCAGLAALPSVARQGGPQAPDAATKDAVSLVIRNAFEALGNRNADEYMALWSANSRDRQRRLELVTSLFSRASRIEFENLQITVSPVDQETDMALVTVDLEAFDSQGQRISDPDLGPLERQIGLVYEAGNWRIDSYSVPIAAFTARLVSATDSQRQALLTESKDWEPRLLLQPLESQSKEQSAQGNPAEAHRVADILCEIGAVRQNPDALGSCYFQHGQIDSDQSPEKAARAYDRAKEQFRIANNVSAEMAADLNAARAYKQANRLDDFQNELRDAEQLRSTVRQPLLEAVLLLDVAEAYSQAGYGKDAIENLREAARLADGVDSQGGKELAARIRLTLGNTLMSNLNGDTDTLMFAINQYEKAYVLARDAGNEDLKAQGLMARSQTLRLWCMTRRTIASGSGREHPAFADVCLEAAEALQIAVHGAENRPYFQIEPLLRLGDIYQYLGDDDEARLSYERGAEIASSLHDFSRVAESYKEIGNLLALRGHWNEAITYYHKALGALDSERAELPERSFESRLSFGSKLDHDIHFDLARALVELSHNNPSEIEAAFEASEQAKSRMLLEALTTKDRDAPVLLTDGEKQRESELREQLRVARTNWEKTRSQANVNAEEWRSADADLHKALRNLQLFEDQLSAKHAEKRSSEKPEIATLQTVNHMLYAVAPGTAILSYVVNSDEGIAFLLTRGNGIDAPAKITPYVLSSKFSEYTAEKFRNECASGEPFRKESASLYEDLFEPLEAELQSSNPRVEHLVVVPDEFLHQLPFHALTDASGQFLIQRYTVTYAPSVSSLILMHDLALSRRRQPDTSLSPSIPMLAVGGAIMPPGFSDLKYSEQEAKQVALLFHVTPITGKDATVDRVKGQMPHARLIHLATHGVLVADSPFRSRVLLSPNQDGTNFLEAEDLLKMSLEADMVVISACNSAAGAEVAGEGPVGLMWALFAARTPTTVATLWSVDDASTSNLMVDFYRHLKDDGKDKASSLREAQLKLIQQHLPPRLWAPFILAGDWTE